MAGGRKEHLMLEKTLKGNHSSQAQKVRRQLKKQWLLVRAASCRSLKKVKVAQSCPTLCNPMNRKSMDILQATILEWVKWSEVDQLCPTLFDPMDYSLPGSSIHGIFQARILAWVAFPFSRGSSQPRDQTQVSRTAGGFFTSWATKEAPYRSLDSI